MTMRHTKCTQNTMQIKQKKKTDKIQNEYSMKKKNRIQKLKQVRIVISYLIPFYLNSQIKNRIRFLIFRF